MKLLLKNKNIFFAQNHCEIQVCTILVCALYSIKYSTNKNMAHWKSNCLASKMGEFEGATYLLLKRTQQICKLSKALAI
jgi:hypothetical protein